MRVRSKKSSVLVWLAVIVAVVAMVVVGHVVSQSKTDSGKDAFKQNVSVEPSKEDLGGTTDEITSGTIITTGESEFGPMLFDDKRQAIYIWELEESTTAECYGECAEAWPPVLTDGTPIASGSVSRELLGTTTRTDGTTQVTYNGHPLYFYAHEAPGEVECHNIRTHGGLWWVIQPSGVRAE